MVFLHLLRAARPRQWIKNLTVGAALVFAKSLGDGPRVLRALAAVAIFCVLSSSVYLWNDVVDVEKDRLHPTKRLRPIAAGQLSEQVARIAAALLAVGGLLGAFLLGPYVALAGAFYLAQNVAYSLRLKHVPYVDIVVIATGFLIRVLAGAAAVDVHPSTWLLACTGLLACFLGFGKRAHELETHGPGSRGVLRNYHPKRLRALLYASGIATVAAYAAYTLSEHTRAFFGTDHMVFTVPCVAIALFRFLQLANRPNADSPTDEMLHDVFFIANAVAYVALVLVIIYVIH